MQAIADEAHGVWFVCGPFTDMTRASCERSPFRRCPRAGAQATSATFSLPLTQASFTLASVIIVITITS